MPIQTRPGTCTFADFLELVQEDQKADLLDGIIYMASPENIEHNDLVFWLGTILRQFAEARGLGQVTINRVAYRLATRVAPEPDLAFVRSQRLNIARKNYMDGPPDLAIEVVSPDSVDRDYESKRRRYQEAGVAEYWILDPDEQRCLFLVNGPDGFTEAAVEAGVFRSRVLEGFRLNISWLWQRPLPATLPIVQQMLTQT